MKMKFCYSCATYEQQQGGIRIEIGWQHDMERGRKAMYQLIMDIKSQISPPSCSSLPLSRPFL